MLDGPDVFVFASGEEMADAPLLDAAYPQLGVTVGDFVGRYLAAPEAVLVPLGPPGTGKTRLVRAILCALSKRKGNSAEVMFTADMRCSRTMRFSWTS